MATERELNILIKAKDEASRVLKQYGEQFTQIGAGLTAIGAAGVAGFGMAIKTAADFEQQMSKVKAISGATDEDFAKLTKTAQNLGATTTKSASEVAAGMENMAAMGFEANEIMAAMPGVIAAAEASGSDMAQTADVMSAALNMFGLEASEASRVADILAKTANISAADLTDMQYALKYAGPPANALGVSLEELSASIGIMTNAGMKGEQAGTTLRGALLGLLDPSEENSKAMEAMGIAITDNEGNFVGLANLIDNLQGSMEGMTDTQKAATLSQLVGKEAVSGMLSLMEAGPDTIKKMTKELENSAGSSAAASAIMTDNLNGALEQMGGAFESASIVIGNQFIPYVRKVAEVVGAAVTWFNDLDASTQKTITMVAAGATVFSLLAGSILLVIPLLPAIGAGIAALLGPVGLVIAAIAALVYMISQNFAAISSAVMGYVQPIITAFNYLRGDMDETVRTGTRMGLSLEEILGEKAFAMVQIFTNLKDRVVEAFTTMEQIIVPLVNQFGQFLTQFWDKNGAQIMSTVQFIWDTVSDIIDTVFAFVVGVIKNHGSTIIKNVTDSFNAVWSIISTIMKYAQDLLSVVWSSIKDLIKNHGDSIMKNVMVAFTGIKDAIKVAADLITDIIDWAFPYIKQIIQLVMSEVVPWVIEMFNKIAAFVGDVMPKIIKVIQWAWESVIKPLFTAVMNFLVPFLEAAWSSISKLISGVMDVVMGVIKTVLSVITGDWSGAWSGIKQTLSGAVQAIGEIIKTIGTILSAPFKLALELVKGLIQSFWNVGADLMRGLINGIKSMVSGIADAALDAVKGAVDAAKDFLGIHSPSRLMMEMGVYTGEGWIIGLKDQAKEAIKTAEEMAAATVNPFEKAEINPAAFSGSMGSGALGSGSGSPQIILQFGEGSVVLPGVTDGQSFVEQLQGFSLRQAFKSQ